ncbi:hypothetical protein BKA93DRAFT_575374 [Sparassis latifolia]
MSAISSLAKHSIRGPGNPWVEQYLAHPDYRVISAFFLGWVFFESARRILLSTFVFQFLRWCGEHFRLYNLRRGFRQTPPDLEASAPQRSSVYMDRNNVHATLRHLDEDVYVFILNTCFAFSSVAQFASLIKFGPHNGDVGCTFVIAWGSMASQTARLVGLLMLGLELKRLRIKPWEVYALWIGLVVALGIAFAMNATSTGNTSIVPGLNFSICYRQLYLPTCLASSLTMISLEVYVCIRLICFKFSVTRPRYLLWAVITDIGILRIASLLVLDLLTVVPATVFSNPLAEFIPFSAGALLVIVLFGRAERTQDLSKTAFLHTAAFESHLPQSARKDYEGSDEAGNQDGRGHTILPISAASNAPDVPSGMDDILHITGAPRKILPSQTEAAEQFEKELVPSGLVMRRPRERPRVFVVIHEESPENAPPNSSQNRGSILGSDIIRRTSLRDMNTTLLSPESLVRSSYKSPSTANSLLSPDIVPWTPRKRRRDSLWSPDSGQSSHGLTSPDDAVERSVLRDSTVSQTTFYRRSRASLSSDMDNAGSDRRGSYSTISSTRVDLVRGHSRRIPPRYSLASRTASGEELPTVMEGLSHGDSSRQASTRRSRRRTFGQPSPRKSRASAHSPMPQLPPLPQFPVLQDQSFAVPPPLENNVTDIGDELSPRELPTETRFDRSTFLQPQGIAAGHSALSVAAADVHASQ